MYSHGSSARVGVGKRGHGGRNYRPPPKRDPSKLVPPPLKECDCIVQLDIPEYAREGLATGTSEDPELPGQQQRRRLHLCFEGSSLNERQKSVRAVERELRSAFLVHLVIPGRNQKGPLAVVGRSYRETIPAVDYFLNHRLVLNHDYDFQNNNDDNNNDDVNQDNDLLPPVLTGRITRNVKDPNGVVLSGRFLQQNTSTRRHQCQRQLSPPPPNGDCDANVNANVNVNVNAINLEPYWLFESDRWKIMACPLLAVPSLLSWQQQQQQQSAIAEALKTSIDNLRFRLGNSVLSELDIFLHQPPPALPPPNSEQDAATEATATASAIAPTAFVAGDPSRASGTALSALSRVVFEMYV
mmetsp:Transcript_10221/g.21913  ORF Transcript_10221/g.21913 Transcript_10221/m.21913 type:complete len:355 (+) Transcript_10221:322-1386(+)